MQQQQFTHEAQAAEALERMKRNSATTKLHASRSELLAQLRAQVGGGVTQLLELKLGVDLAVLVLGCSQCASVFARLESTPPFFIFRVVADLTNAPAMALGGVAYFGGGFGGKTKHWIETQVGCMRACAHAYPCF